MSNNGLGDALWPGYPRVTEEQAQQWLASPYPAWQFTPEGVITTTNLMALWIWRAIGVKSHEVRPQLVLSVSVFDVVSRNLDYIPVFENEAFFKKVIWDAKRIGQQLGRAGRRSISAFLTAMQSDPQRREIYEEVILFDEAHRSSDRKRESEYPLRIVTPPNGDEPKNLLRFTIAEAVVCGKNDCLGLVSRARPEAESRGLIQQEYRKLTRQYATMPYVLSAEPRGGGVAIKEQEPGPTTNIDKQRIFADEKAKIAWEIAQAVENVTVALPPEGLNLSTRLITFEAEHARKGRYALFLSGTVIGTDRKGVFSVPERSVRILRTLNIPYHYVDPGQEAQ